MINCRCADLLAKDASYLSTNCVLCADQFEPSQFMNPTRLFGGGLIVIVNNVQYLKWFYLSQCWLFCYVIMLFECTFLFLLCFPHCRQFNCLLILWCFCSCALCDYDLFGVGLIVIVNHVFEPFPKGRCKKGTSYVKFKMIIASFHSVNIKVWRYASHKKYVER